MGQRYRQGCGAGGQATPTGLPETCIRTGSSQQHDLLLLGPVCRNACVPTSHRMRWRRARETQIPTGAQTKCNPEKTNTRAKTVGRDPKSKAKADLGWNHAWGFLCGPAPSRCAAPGADDALRVNHGGIAEGRGPTEACHRGHTLSCPVIRYRPGTPVSLPPMALKATPRRDRCFLVPRAACSP